jgi:class 3 adenylate cyclase
MTNLLNRVFGPITAAIDRQGGSVISFGGDSVICWFGDDDGLRATTVALELIEILGRFRQGERGGPGEQLDIKAAVASGTAQRLRVGHPAHSFMDVLAGEVIQSLSLESASLNPGEVAVSPEVAQAIGHRAKLRTTNETTRPRHLVEEIVEPPPPQSSIDAGPVDRIEAGDWLLPFVRDHLEHGLGGLMGQLVCGDDVRQLPWP